jgi:hypothetical protein
MASSPFGGAGDYPIPDYLTPLLADQTGAPCAQQDPWRLIGDGGQAGLQTSGPARRGLVRVGLLALAIRSTGNSTCPDHVDALSESFSLLFEDAHGWRHDHSGPLHGFAQILRLTELFCPFHVGHIE